MGAAGLQPAMGLGDTLPLCSTVFVWCMRPAFWVNFKGLQEVGLALGDIWGNGCQAGAGQPSAVGAFGRDDTTWQGC